MCPICIARIVTMTLAAAIGLGNARKKPINKSKPLKKGKSSTTRKNLK
ncbi:hypothetical protein TetV_359 [Tetraselmis virus 1]|uniref:Uncharacterized protein n=1 Tax=Tetraselmis virus 1 TaxID=2060617 RepID=A0A2P0VNG9_9VIRU|nr:hypothetical protein QJ968_gp359 [Tetraselmis virus 1]AUF82451.1 hypothetical protein TetV_359 [Tetraselmis virus 1]